jgi:hypothetical protein
VIPVADRVKFLDSFGVVDPGEPPLVRVGERDGTVIYRQNQPGGEWEYRLLVAANAAFLTRSAEECRQLAASVGSLVAEPFAAPVEATLRRSGLASPHIPGTDWLSTLPALPMDLAEISKVPGLLTQAWQELSNQTASVTFTAQSGPQGDLRLTARLIAKPDTPLAGWIPTQRPSAERLAGQLRTPATAMMVSGRLTFQGQLERWAFEQAVVLRTAAAARWNDNADGAFRGFCTLLERCGESTHAPSRSHSLPPRSPAPCAVVNSARCVFTSAMAAAWVSLEAPASCSPEIAMPCASTIMGPNAPRLPLGTRSSAWKPSGNSTLSPP